ncbi:hypothetical protein DCC79_14945, partial [bacterium]
MPVTRRSFLAAGGAAAAGAAAVRLEPPPDGSAGPGTRPRIAWATGRLAPLPAPSPEHHRLNRAACGA